MTEMQIAVLVIGGIVLVKVIDHLIARFFKRTVDTDYVTTTTCRLCREECQQQRSQGNKGIHGEMSDLGRSLDVLRGIMLVIAVKVGVDAEVLQDLAHGRRSGDR